jgi:predicted RNA-binding protein YlqC (UPF0109 family)
MLAAACNQTNGARPSSTDLMALAVADTHEADDQAGGRLAAANSDRAEKQAQKSETSDSGETGDERTGGEGGQQAQPDDSWPQQQSQVRRRDETTGQRNEQRPPVTDGDGQQDAKEMTTTTSTTTTATKLSLDLSALVSPQKRLMTSRRIDIRLLVRRREAGALIGKRGANIKRMREQFKDSTFNIPDTGSGPERVVCISAFSWESLEAILMEIGELFLDKSCVLHSGEEQVELRLLINSAYAGLLIGVGGQSIRKLRNVSSA